VGISIVSALLVENAQVNHENIAAYVTPFNHAFDAAAAQGMSPLTAAGRAALNELITLQSTVIAYIDDFKLLMIMSLAVIPLVLLLRKPKVAPVMDHSAVME
jgi:DHA2 family multidrug resistance protein